MQYYKFKIHFNSFYKKILKDYFMYYDTLNLVIKYTCVYDAYYNEKIVYDIYIFYIIVYIRCFLNFISINVYLQII